MSLIVAARFQTFDEATEAAQRLRLEGFSEDELHTFYINTAGEHARFPLGGDRVADPDARGAQARWRAPRCWGCCWRWPAAWWPCGRAPRRWW